MLHDAGGHKKVRRGMRRMRGDLYHHRYTFRAHHLHQGLTYLSREPFLHLKPPRKEICNAA